MREKTRLLLLAGLIAIMAFAFAACDDSDSDEKSGTDNTNSQKQETTEATEPTTEATETSDYDIMEGFQLKEDGSQMMLYGNDFMLIMPNDDDWGYNKISDTCMEIYLKDAREDKFGGNLVSIMAFDPEDTSYEEFPDYSVAGHGVNSGKTFIALFPTDVQYNPEDSDQQEDYMELYDHVKKIAEGMANSPFYTKDSDAE